MMPKRREKGLLIEQLADEMIAYDTTNHKIHCLKSLALVVWQHCDGHTSELEMADIVRQELGVPADERLIQLTLQQLAEAELIEERSCLPTKISRREVARQLAKFGIAATAALVATIAAPTPALAATNNCVSTLSKPDCLQATCFSGAHGCQFSSGCFCP
jgi:hypothetical protein